MTDFVCVHEFVAHASTGDILWTNYRDGRKIIAFWVQQGLVLLNSSTLKYWESSEAIILRRRFAKSSLLYKPFGGARTLEEIQLVFTLRGVQEGD